MEGEGDRTGGPARRWKRRIVVVVCVLAALYALCCAAPHVLGLVSFPEVSLDFSESMKDTPPWLFPDKTLTMKYGVSRRDGGGFTVSARGRVLGWPFSASADIDLSLGFCAPRATGCADFRLDGSGLGASAVFTASLSQGWAVDLEMPETRLTENDPFLAALLARHPEKKLRSLAFDGLLSLAAHASRTNGLFAPPRWDATCRVAGLDASMANAGKPVRIGNFRMRAGASGIADHVDIAPMFPRADCIEGGGCALSNVFASVRATETAYLVTEAGADFCGGALRLYAMFLDPKKLNAGVTLYIDNIDAGQALGHLNGFKGHVTGTLNGKLPLRLANGSQLHFDAGYLHSVPGECGKFKIYDPTPVTDNLAMTGLDKDTTDNIANALTDLDYTALRIGLKPEGDGVFALEMKLEGTAERGGVTVPVSICVTFHGNLEQLINTGLRVATRKEQST